MITEDRIRELIEQIVPMLSGNDETSEEECWRSFGVDPEAAIGFFEGLHRMDMPEETKIAFAFGVGVMVGRDQ